MKNIKNLNIYTLNAFAKTIKGGNPAGVVLEADNLSDTQMQEIAKKIGFSETAFISMSDIADFKLRFFTPNREIDLCGHATIASFFLMANLNFIQAGKYTQETKAGRLDIEVKQNGIILMNQNLPHFFEKIDRNEIANSLNIPIEIMDLTLPIQIVSTGLKDIFIPIKNIPSLNTIKPNFEKIYKISKKYNVVGYHLFTLDKKNNSTVHCRNFAPVYDISEEAATGTSNGALSCYLWEYNKITNEQVSNLVYKQGYSMGKPSEILANLTIENNKITEVRVGGIASNIKKIIL